MEPTLEQLKSLRHRVEKRERLKPMIEKLDKKIAAMESAKTDPPVGLSPAVPANPARARRVR